MILLYTDDLYLSADVLYVSLRKCGEFHDL